MKRILYLLFVFLLTLGTVALVGCTEGGSTSNTDESSEASLPAEESALPVITKLRIGTYNIANGREIDHDMQIIANDILEQGLDIVGLQEVDRNSPRSKNLDTIALLSELTGYKYYTYVKCLDLGTIGSSGDYGTAILSKYPIIETGETELNPGDRVERRMLGYAKIDVNGTVINFYNTHLTIQDDVIRKYMEFPKVVETLKGVENCFLTGDFNVDGFSEFDGLAEFMNLTNNPERDIVTCPDEEMRRIDNIIYSDDFTIDPDSVGIRENSHSDHYMLYADFIINANVTE